MSGRLLSILSAVVSRQSLLQRALNTSQQIVIRFTQSQPAKTQPLTATYSIDPTVSLFFRPTKTSIDYIQSADQSEIICSFDSVCISKTLKQSLNDVQQKIREEAFDTEALRVESIDELVHKEVKSSYEYMSLASLYSKLAKLRLTGLVVTTTMAGYALAPGPFSLSTLLLCATGTGLVSASANALNQVFEVPYDSQMLRTRSRPLVKVLLSPLHAVGFAAVTGSVGLLLLASAVNNLTALLAVSNLVIYCALYTPMKRMSTANTSLGAVVGAIPPLIGWAAATGTLHAGAWLLAGIMYAWQFPHFCALSWNLRADYSRAGYRMMSVIKPLVCRRQAVQYSLLVAGLCLAMPYYNVTTWTFAADSLPVNGYLAYLAVRFYSRADSSSSRRLFHYTLVHLPALLVLMLISKKYHHSRNDSTRQISHV